MSHHALLDFAREEVARAGLLDKDADYGGEPARLALDLIERLCQARPSGQMAAQTLMIFDRLSQHQPLTPVTDDPSEWIDRTVENSGQPLWQNRRATNLMSTDGGKTYYDINAPKAEAPAPPSTESLLEALETAWGIIANAGGGNWHTQTTEWQEAAERWRDEQYHPILDALPKPQQEVVDAA
jgi:hypothetical protein